MADPQSTRWTLVRGAAEGEAAAREEFARLYEPAVRAYYGARWRHSAMSSDLEDAVQEVFLACFREGGVLARAEVDRPGGFRPYLYGVARNVALRLERQHTRRRARTGDGAPDPDRLPADEERLSQAFDRAWAMSLIREAADHQVLVAAEGGEGAERRVELLRLRFHEGLPIREIARRWGEDANRLHYEYAKARREFRAALTEVVAAHQGGTSAEVERECSRLLDFFG
jgi:RNA polymerase sigma-70 factor (ECF subfamily)